MVRGSRGDIMGIFEYFIVVCVLISVIFFGIIVIKDAKYFRAIKKYYKPPGIVEMPLTQTTGNKCSCGGNFVGRATLVGHPSYPGQNYHKYITYCDQCNEREFPEEPFFNPEEYARMKQAYRGETVLMGGIGVPY